MDWCGADLGCWGYWFDASGVRWAQVVVSGVIAWLAVRGPKKEREYQEGKQKEERLRQHRKEQQNRLEHAIGVLRVMLAAAGRLEKTGNLLDQWLNDENRETAQIRRIRADLEIDDRSCSAIPLSELSDQVMIDSVLEVSRQAKLLMLAIDYYVSTFRPVSGGDLVNVSILERGHAFKNLDTARLYLELADIEKAVKEALSIKLQDLERILSMFHAESSP